MAASCTLTVRIAEIYGSAFLLLSEVDKMIEGYTTIKNIAEKWGITPRRVQVMYSRDKIPGAVKFGRDWAIPADAEKTEDSRITTGEYRNWRKKKKIAWNDSMCHCCRI